MAVSVGIAVGDKMKMTDTSLDTLETRWVRDRIYL